MKTFHVQTLGCKVNHYESEQIAALLRSRGLIPADAPASADLRVVNTCSVTTQAASQSRQSVRRMVRLPVLGAAPASAGACDAGAAQVLPAAQPSPPSQSSPGRRSRVLVTGCWATSNTADAAAMPGVDAVLGHRHDVAGELDRLLARWEMEDKRLVSMPIVSVESADSRQADASAPAGGGTDVIQPNRSETVNEKLPPASAAIPAPLDPLSPRATRTLSRSDLLLPGATTLPLLGLRQPGRQRAFLKIQDGCDAHCTYCIIPSLRPKLWSKPVESAVEEARALIAAGHVEIILTGIFLGAYGQPTALRRRQPQSTARPLGELISALCQRVPGLRRLRLSSLEPGDLTPELIDVLRSHRQVVPHFHLPLQSGSDPLLRRMNRQYTSEDFLRMIERVRSAFDRPALTTDVVVGFPGESDEEFERTAHVVKEAGFIHIHAFPYSPRPGTAAARWTTQFVRGPVVNERIERLRQIGDDQGFAFRSSFLGETAEVIVERDGEASPGASPARHGRCERYFDITLDDASLQPGDSVRAVISQVTREQTLGRVVGFSIPSGRAAVSASVE